MWPAWKLKICQTTKKNGTFYPPGEANDELQAQETRIYNEVMELDQDSPGNNSTDEDPAGPPVSDRDEIALAAERYKNTYC